MWASPTRCGTCVVLRELVFEVYRHLSYSFMKCRSAISALMYTCVVVDITHVDGVMADTASGVEVLKV